MVRGLGETPIRYRLPRQYPLGRALSAYLFDVIQSVECSAGRGLLKIAVRQGLGNGSTSSVTAPGKGQAASVQSLSLLPAEKEAVSRGHPIID
jgi:hypothetical protein